MTRNRKLFFKIAVEVLVVVLGLFSVCLFLKAISNGEKDEKRLGHEMQIHVFINQNDSIVNKLQKDVERLSFMIEQMHTDTVVIEMRKPSVSE